jgi:hypothetical protein
MSDIADIEIDVNAHLCPDHIFKRTTLQKLPVPHPRNRLAPISSSVRFKNV